MQLDLTQKTALVCGASQGLGAAVARELAQLGAHVILLARQEDNLKAVLQSLDTSLRQQHHSLVADTQYPLQLQEKLQELLPHTGPVHILVNNSGGPASGPLIDTDIQALELAFRSHLITAHLLAQTLVPGMKAAGYGRIINIVSTSVK